jgi:hypothetical protein
MRTPPPTTTPIKKRHDPKPLNEMEKFDNNKEIDSIITTDDHKPIIEIKGTRFLVTDFTIKTLKTKDKSCRKNLRK